MSTRKSGNATVERLTEGGRRVPTKYFLYQSIEVGQGRPVIKSWQAISANNSIYLLSGSLMNLGV